MLHVFRSAQHTISIHVHTRNCVACYIPQFICAEVGARLRCQAKHIIQITSILYCSIDPHMYIAFICYFRIHDIRMLDASRSARHHKTNARGIQATPESTSQTKMFAHGRQQNRIHILTLSPKGSQTPLAAGSFTELAQRVRMEIGAAVRWSGWEVART